MELSKTVERALRWARMEWQCCLGMHCVLVGPFVFVQKHICFGLMPIHVSLLESDRLRSFVFVAKILDCCVSSLHRVSCWHGRRRTWLFRSYGGCLDAKCHVVNTQFDGFWALQTSHIHSGFVLKTYSLLFQVPLGNSWGAYQIFLGLRHFATIVCALGAVIIKLPQNRLDNAKLRNSEAAFKESEPSKVWDPYLEPHTILQTPLKTSHDFFSLHHGKSIIPSFFWQFSTSQEYNIFPNLIWLRFPRLLDVALREGSGGEGAAEQLNTCWPGRFPRGIVAPFWGRGPHFLWLLGPCQMSVSRKNVALYRIYGFQQEWFWFCFLEKFDHVLFGYVWEQMVPRSENLV